jgi:hypothetical protein
VDRAWLGWLGNGCVFTAPCLPPSAGPLPCYCPYMAVFPALPCHPPPSSDPTLPCLGRLTDPILPACTACLALPAGQPDPRPLPG